MYFLQFQCAHSMHQVWLQDRLEEQPGYESYVPQRVDEVPEQRGFFVPQRVDLLNYDEHFRSEGKQGEKVLNSLRIFNVLVAAAAASTTISH